MLETHAGNDRCISRRSCSLLCASRERSLLPVISNSRMPMTQTLSMDAMQQQQQQHADVSVIGCR